MLLRSHAAWLSLCLALFAPAPLARDRAGELASAAKTALDAGQQDEALEKVQLALEWSPDDVSVLDLASRAAEAAKEPDLALWYAALAIENADSPEAAALAESAKKRLAELDPLAGKDQAVLGEYAGTLLALGNDCASKKLWVNAVDLLSRTKGSSSAPAADAALAKVYANKKAVEALLDSGLDVPIQAKQKRGSAAKAAEEDKKHGKWENAWEIKGDCYTIKTDLPRELAEQMSIAMEQMNAFYRKVFHVKEHGGGDTARCTISIYRTRAEFDKFEGERDKDVAGFFVPNVNHVATYDPREDGRAISELWSTLFHESSHQFTHMISADLIPAWLNEGTASYFEGARLLPNAAVETNLVPEERLLWLREYISKGDPKLEEVVRFFKPGSYEGEYYPFGWGLVYFLLNYENEKSVRIYEGPYHDFTAAYKSGGKHDVFERFVEYFVTKAKDPSIKTFADFEARWRKWILELHELYFGPPEKADVLIARGRKQRADKQPESAVESFRWALRKRPEDAVANFELGETLNGLKQTDAALYHYQRCLQALRAFDDASTPPSSTRKASELAADVQARIAKLNKDFAEKLARVEASFVSNASTTAKAYAEKGLPLYALRFLTQTQASFGRSNVLTSLRSAIATASGADSRRWRRFPIAPGLAGWQGADEFVGSDEDIRMDKGGAGFLWADSVPTIPYRLEARMEYQDLKQPSLGGLMFGESSEADALLAILVIGPKVFASEYGKKGWKEEDSLLGKIEKPERPKALTLAIEVREREVEAFVDGVSVGKKEYEPKKLRGGVGLYAQGGITFRDVRVRD